MKVAILGENYYPTLGGVQEHIYNLARYLRGRGDDVRVVTGLPDLAGGPWRGPRDDAGVVRVGRARRYGVMGTVTTMTFGPAVAARLRRLLRDERFDLVHVHAPCDIGLPILLYALYDGPIVATLHSPINDASPLRRLAAPYYQWVLDRTDAVIAVSEAARTAMRRYTTFTSVTLPNGVDTAAMSTGRPLPAYDDGRTNLLMLGRLEPRNGPDLMFEALPRIVAARPDLDVRLLVAGTGKDGLSEWKARVPESVRGRVEFLGSVFEERPDVYASARLCVVPARSGTFSIIVLEALAAGVPVVATPFIHDHASLPHFGPVHVTPGFEPAQVADTILGALAEDPAARIAAGRAIAQTFDWSQVGGQIATVYDDVLRARRRAGVMSAAAPALRSDR